MKINIFNQLGVNHISRCYQIRFELKIDLQSLTLNATIIELKLNQSTFYFNHKNQNQLRVNNDAERVKI